MERATAPWFASRIVAGVVFAGSFGKMITYTPRSVLLIGRSALDDQIARVLADTSAGRGMAAGLTVSKPPAPDPAGRDNPRDGLEVAVEGLPVRR